MRVFRTMLIRGDLMYPCGVQARVPCQSQAVVLIQLKVVDWDTPQAYAELSIPCLSSQANRVEVITHRSINRAGVFAPDRPLDGDRHTPWEHRTSFILVSTDRPIRVRPFPDIVSPCPPL